MRDALHGIKTMEELSKSMPYTEAVYAVNKIAQEYLVRPMGIFQLIDYVGIDVVSFIMKVMNPYMKDEDLHSDLLDRLMESGVRGGQYSSGAQKDGFFKYEKGRIVGIYDTDKKAYVTGDDFMKIVGDVNSRLGEMPDSTVAWKSTLRMKNKDEVLGKFFDDLKQSETMGARLAVAYGKRSNEIGKKLVADGVAGNDEDVNTVMLTGFFHAYGPINEYFG
jgi:hypothetical protein